MTILEAYRACLIEINKVQAPTLLLDDFNYLFNKAIQKYFNKRYNLFEINLQLTDDLRVLTATKELILLVPDSAGAKLNKTNQIGNSISYRLPDDYVHILNCICLFENTEDRCNEDPDNPTLLNYGATKVDSSLWSQIITNHYMRPSMTRPYYYISNIIDPDDNSIVDLTISSRSGGRYGNEKTPIIEIKCGKLSSRYNLKKVVIDYLRAPRKLELTRADIDSPTDGTATLEFPDYVIYEIINELVTSMLENASDGRILTFPTVNTSIAAASAQLQLVAPQA